MFFNRCPVPEDLYRFARQPDSARIAKHLAICEKCRAALERIREEERLLEELRAADRGEVNEALRARLLKLCQGLIAHKKND